MKAVMSLNILLAVIFFVSSSEANTMTEQSLVNLSERAQRSKLTYLPQFIEQQQLICGTYRDSERESCLIKAMEGAEKILACPTSRVRFQEGVEYDNAMSKETFLKNEMAAIPEKIQKNFDLLANAIAGDLNKTFHLKLKLEAYKSKDRNAHAALNGNVFLSEGLWKSEEALNDDEITAIMAHEVTHVIELHGMDLNCMAIEWTSPDYTVKFAQSAFQEDLRGSLRFDIWSALSVKLEYAADAGAVKILKAAGFNPLLMAQALEKLKPKVSSLGFTSGSHPEFDIRIAAARAAAAK